MNKLCIIAHPSKSSITYRAGEILKNNSIDIIDLYRDKNYMQDFLIFDDVTQQKVDTQIISIQEKISNCDELILIYPIWWGEFPAILKNFLDVNLSYGFAFEYGKNGEIVQKLNSKRISIFCTCNSPKQRYRDIVRKHIKLHFEECCGMKLKNFEIFDLMRFSTNEKQEYILNKIGKLYE